MNVSGTLHFYSGDRREFFFVFDDDVAQQLYRDDRFDVDDLDSRRVWISVGSDRFIHRRTMSFSRKQTEIKVSLCAEASKGGLRALTSLYDWFAGRGQHPKPFSVIGTLTRTQREGARVWELHITEPVDIVVPPGLTRRPKTPPPERRSYSHRRQFIERDLEGIGRTAEELALALALDDYPQPKHICLWRKTFLDSERIEIRRMGIIADIDVWNVQNAAPEVFIEVKAQKVPVGGASPAFHLSLSEWRSHKQAVRRHIPYQVWLFQYRDLRHFSQAPHRIELVVFEHLDEEWLQPDSYLVTPKETAGVRFPLMPKN